MAYAAITILVRTDNPEQTMKDLSGVVDLLPGARYAADLCHEDPLSAERVVNIFQALAMAQGRSVLIEATQEGRT